MPPRGLAQTLESVNSGLSVKVAPGEKLPVAVKLSNFGGGTRVDVILTYLITSEKDVEIYKTTETVAVETTNNFIKNIQIPSDTSPGIYTAKTTISYPGQLAPATTEFKFTVERKIFGLFQSSFTLYGGGTLALAVLTATVGYTWVKRRSVSRAALIDYSNIDGDERVFYELISDTVLGMRQKVGDKALDIAGSIEGLKINKDTGRVENLTQSPSKIIAELVSGYEKSLGTKVSFAFRNPKV